MSEIDLSIVIPTFNRRASLAKVLTGLEIQTCSSKSYEVIVVSDGSTDGTDRFLQEYRPSFALRPVYQSNQGVGSARNIGVEHAKSDYILFLDDDVCPVPELVYEHIRG